MPAAPRPSKKAEKLAYKVIGKPANLQESKKKSNVDKRLTFEETARVK